MYIYYSISLNFSENETFMINFVEKTNTQILCSIAFFPENRAVYAIMRKKIWYSRRGHSWI